MTSLNVYYPAPKYIPLESVPLLSFCVCSPLLIVTLGRTNHCLIAYYAAGILRNLCDALLENQADLSVTSGRPATLVRAQRLRSRTEFNRTAFGLLTLLRTWSEWD